MSKTGTHPTITGLFADVGEFHEKFGLGHYGDGSPPGHLEADVAAFRIGFMLEELSEMARAISQKDLPKVADAIVDLVYVALGTAQLMGLPFDELWAEVHRANLRKERVVSEEDDRSVRRHRLDVIKPAGWTPPDIEGVLARYLP